MTTLKYLLNPLFEELNTQNISYCICGNYHDLPEHTSHDVDILAIDVRKVEKILFEVAESNGFTIYLCNKNANGSNIFLYKNLDGDNTEFVRIDISNGCSWFSFIPILKAERILMERIKYKNFYIADPIVEAGIHLLFPLINHGEIKEKYKEKIYAFRDNQRFYDIISDALGSKITKFIIERVKQKDWDTIEKYVLKYKIILFFRNILHFNLKHIKDFYNFIWTNLYRIFKPSGLFITFIGPDGAGKTTVIHALTNFFEHGFLSGNKIKQFYWRPFLLPPLKRLNPFHRGFQNSGSKKIINYQSTPFKTVISFIKFFYYFVDTVVGSVKYQQAWARGGIVCFDRYYYDHLVYPQRFGFKVPHSIMNFFKNFIPIPDLVFYLYSPPETLKMRKDEFETSEVEIQVRGYDNLISNLTNIYRIDTTCPINKVVNEIINICIKYMGKRQKKKYPDKRFCGWYYMIPKESTLIINKKIGDNVLLCSTKYGYNNIPTKTIKKFNHKELKETLHNLKNKITVFLVSTRTPLFMLKRFLYKNNLEYVFSYILASSFFNPRLFLPFSRKLIKQIDKILKPTRYKALAAMKFLHILNLIRCPQLLFSSQLIITKRRNDKVASKGVLKEFLSKKLGRDDLEYILYTGAPGVYQKFIAQVMDRKGKIIGYAKIAHTEEVKIKMFDTVKVSNYLKNQNLSTIEIPEIICFEQLEPCSDLIILQTPTPEGYRKWDKSLTEQHVVSLIELFQKTRKNIYTNLLLENLKKNLYQVKDAFIMDNYNLFPLLENVLERLEKKISNTELTLGFSHGDFMPWNIKIGKSKLFAFDWEESGYRVPMWDLYYFMLYSKIVASTSNYKKILKLLLNKKSGCYTFMERYQSCFEQSMFFDKNIFCVITLYEIILSYICQKIGENELYFEGNPVISRIIKTASSILREALKEI